MHLPKETYHHDNLKAELIEKGLKLLDQEGYEGFSLRKVAKACNASHAAPYRHFKNKDELIFSIGREAKHQFAVVLQQAVDKYPDNPRYQLKEMGFAYIRFFVENPEYLRLMFLSDLKERLQNCLENPEDNAFEKIKDKEDPFQILSETVKRYKAASGEGDSSQSPDSMILYCWGLVHGIAILIARKEFPYEGDCLELARTLIWDKAF